MTAATVEAKAPRVRALTDTQLAFLRTLAGGPRRIDTKSVEMRTVDALLKRGDVFISSALGTGKGLVVSATLAMIPELVETKPGRPYVWKASRGSSVKNVKIDREWDVLLGGEKIGSVKFALVTHETRSAGRTYVNKRWTSPGWKHQFAYESRWFDSYSKTGAIETLVRALRPFTA